MMPLEIYGKWDSYQSLYMRRKSLYKQAFSVLKLQPVPLQYLLWIRFVSVTLRHLQ